MGPLEWPFCGAPYEQPVTVSGSQPAESCPDCMEGPQSLPAEPQWNSLRLNWPLVARKSIIARAPPKGALQCSLGASSAV